MAAEERDVGPELGDPALTRREQHDVVLVRHIVQWLLRTGLAISFASIAAGLVMKFATGDHRSPSVRLFDLNEAPRTSDRLMALGILVLAATPAFRVLSLVVLWTWERDWRFVAVALVVMATLGAAVVIGHG